MSKVTAAITISVDGYIAGPDDGPGKGLGEGGERLHHWVFGGPWTSEGETRGEASGEDAAWLERMISRPRAVRDAGGMQLDRHDDPGAGIVLARGMVAVMWVVEIIDSLDSHRLDTWGIRPHHLDRLIGIVTAPFLHVSFGHLESNTVPFV